MNIKKHYTNPPLIEALCEFHFDPSTPEDLTVPGLLYAALEDKYPIKRQQSLLNQQFLATPKGPHANINMVNRLQFFNKTETALVQINPHFLSVNHLKPYPTWDKFLPMVEEVLRRYYDIVNPSRCLRMGVRFINRIELPGPQSSLGEYFEFRPHLGSLVPKDFIECTVGITLPFKQKEEALRLQLTSLPGGPETIPIMLDLNYFRTDGNMDLDNVIKWLDGAHENIESVFEAAITDSCRALFHERTE